MSVSEDLRRNAYDVRRRLRNPPNAVVDLGIDLKRKFQPPVIIAIEPEPELPPSEPIEIPAFIPAQPEVIDSDEMTQDATEPQGKYPSIHTIFAHVCRHFDITKDAFKGKRRWTRLVRARFAAVFLCRKLTNKSYPYIALHLGHRDHSSIVHCFQCAEERLLFDSDFAFDVATIEAELLVLCTAFPPVFHYARRNATEATRG
jgi:hypothetical protein